MYVLLDKNYLGEYVPGMKEYRLRSISHFEEGKTALSIFQHKFDARFYLAKEKYLFNNPNSNYIEVSVSDPHVQNLIESKKESLFTLNAFDHREKRQITKLVTYEELHNLSDQVISDLYVSRQLMEAYQQFYNDMPIEEIDLFIDKVLLDGDNCKKLVLDTGALSTALQKHQEDYTQSVKLLASHGIKKLPLFILAYPNDVGGYATFGFYQYPAIFTNELDAYIYKETPIVKQLEQESGQEYQIYKLSAPACMFMREYLLDYYQNLGSVEVPVVHGFQSQANSSLKHTVIIGAEGNPLVYSKPEPLTDLRTGYTSIAPLANLMTGRSKEEQKEIIENYTIIQSEPPELLQARAQGKFKLFCSDLSAYNPELPIILKALF